MTGEAIFIQNICRNLRPVFTVILHEYTIPRQPTEKDVTLLLRKSFRMPTLDGHFQGGRAVETMIGTDDIVCGKLGLGIAIGIVILHMLKAGKQPAQKNDAQSRQTQSGSQWKRVKTLSDSDLQIRPPSGRQGRYPRSSPPPLPCEQQYPPRWPGIPRLLPSWGTSLPDNW